jgi:hypothetical protein
MTTTIISLVILIISVLAIVLVDPWEYEVVRGISWVTGVISFLIALFLLIGIPIRRYDVRHDIARLEAFRETVNNSRHRDLKDIERFAFLKEVAAWNEKLAGCKFDNQNDWDLWIPDEIENVEPIK